MELDFTKLNQLAFLGYMDTKIKRQASRMHSETFLESESYETSLKKENVLQGQIDGLHGITILQWQTEANKTEKEGILAVYEVTSIHGQDVPSSLLNKILKRTGLK